MDKNEEEPTDKEESIDKKEESADKKEDLSDMSSLKSEEEVKQGKGLKILTPNKLLTRLPIINRTNKSWKLFKQIKKWNQKNTTSFVLA